MTKWQKVTIAIMSIVVFGCIAVIAYMMLTDQKESDGTIASSGTVIREYLVNGDVANQDDKYSGFDESGKKLLVDADKWISERYPGKTFAYESLQYDDHDHKSSGFANVIEKTEGVSFKVFFSQYDEDAPGKAKYKESYWFEKNMSNIIGALKSTLAEASVECKEIEITIIEGVDDNVLPGSSYWEYVGAGYEVYVDGDLFYDSDVLTEETNVDKIKNIILSNSIRGKIRLHGRNEVGEEIVLIPLDLESK